MPQMRVKDMTTDDLPDLEAQLQHALDKALASELPAHKVRNCPSDSENRTQAWRKVQNLQYQIECIKNGRTIY
jgi:transcriptional/translational regulatory protein YebC/TACO1